METEGHRRLKRLGVGLLRSWGFRAVATEVRCPATPFRVDVAGHRRWRDERGEPREQTVILECKRSRADFRSDDGAESELLRRRRGLESRKRELEEGLVRRLEPHLRRSGGSLFPELERWDFGASRSVAYRAVTTELERVDRHLHGHTKFARMARYGVADRLYVLATRGIVRSGEVPVGWGLIEWRADDGAGRLHEVHDAPAHDPLPRRRRALLEGIARAASDRAWPDREGASA